MEVRVGSLWKHKETGEGVVVRYLGISKDINNTEVDVVGTLSDSGRSYVYSHKAIVKYFDEVDDV